MPTDWITYFKERPAYQKLFTDFKKKYQSLGKSRGSVSLKPFEQAEIQEFALFLGMTPEELSKKQKLSLQLFEQKLIGRKFPDITLHQLLEHYFECAIRANKDLLIEKKNREQATINHYKASYPEITPWLTYLENRSADTFWIWGLINEGNFALEVAIIYQAYQNLPTTLERYPLFSQRITGDPHRFDLASVTGRLFLHLLHIMLGNQTAPSKLTEAVNEQLLAVNLLRDDISNFVTLVNILGLKAGNYHPVWQAAHQQHSVLNVPLRELLLIDEVQLSPTSKRVFVVENSGVFSSLVDAAPNATLVCTHGQFKLAGLRLLDLLVSAGYLICYSGDFDPEGLSMALRLAERYPKNCCFWRMEIDDYLATNPTVQLGARSNKFAALQGLGFDKLIAKIEAVGRIGYQEGIIESLIADLQSEYLS